MRAQDGEWGSYGGGAMKPDEDKAVAMAEKHGFVSDKPGQYVYEAGCALFTKAGLLAFSEAIRADERQLLVEAAEWQPIETAPKDGTQIIVPSQWTGLNVDVASYGTNGWWSCKLELPIETPTIWHPLPEAPTQEVGINGLTKAETSASASVMGLTRKG